MELELNNLLDCWWHKETSVCIHMESERSYSYTSCHKKKLWIHPTTSWQQPYCRTLVKEFCRCPYTGHLQVPLHRTPRAASKKTNKIYAFLYKTNKHIYIYVYINIYIYITVQIYENVWTNLYNSTWTRAFAAQKQGYVFFFAVVLHKGI